MAYTLTYSYANNAYSVTGYTDTPDNVVIPDVYDDGVNGEHPVTSISDYAFKSCSSLISIVIGNNITDIGKQAFYLCNNLTNVTMSDNVTTIGESAFESCINITDVTIPNSVTSIVRFAFYGCTSLTRLVIGSSVANIGTLAFGGCTHLIRVNLLPLTPPTLDTDVFKNINSGAKFYCYESVINDYKSASGWSVYANQFAILENYELVYNFANNAYTVIGYTGTPDNVVIPDTYNDGTHGEYSIKVIAASLFEDCDSLITVTIPNNLRTIGENAFKGCTNLTAVYITTLIRWCKMSFGNEYSNPLYYAHNLYFNGNLVENLVIPIEIKDLVNYAFCNCTCITSIDFGNNVRTIGNYTFYHCTGITNLTIPNNITSIGDYAFSDCLGLTTVNLGSSVINIGNGAFSACINLLNINIPDSVTTIGVNAFHSCIELKNIIIPVNVTAISDGLFYNCESLKNVFIKGNVTTIGNSAFFGCSSLSNISIPESVTDIDDFAFEGCTSVTNITIPSNITSIGRWAFENCTNLVEVDILPRIVPILGEGAFSSINTYAKFYCFLSVIDFYKNAWSTYANRFVAGDIRLDFVMNSRSLKQYLNDVLSNYVSKSELDSKNYVTDVVDPIADTNYARIKVNTSMAWLPYDIKSTFSQNSWAVIKAVAKAGAITQFWNIGDTKDITLTNGAVLTYRISDAQIGRYALADGTGVTKVVFEPVSLVPKMTGFANGAAYMNSGYNNKEGFEDSDMRYQTLPLLYDLFPQEVKDVISEIVVLSGRGVRDDDTPIEGTIGSVTKFFIPAEVEYFGTAHYSIGLAESPLGQYDYYKTHNTDADRIKYRSEIGNNITYWMRSPTATLKNRFCCVNQNGGADYGNAPNEYGVAPCFAIG